MKLFDLDIYGGKYTVEYKHLAGQGETHLDRAAIYLSPEYPLEHQKVTLLHEVLHVCFSARWQYQVDAVASVSDAGTREHLLIDPIACSLYDVLKVNTNFRQWLFGGEVIEKR